MLAARERRYEGIVHAQANVWQTSPLLAPVSVALPHLGLIGDIVTDSNGDATVETGLTVGGRLRGPLAVVSNLAGSPLTTSIETTGGADVLDYGVTAEFEVAQTTAFYWATRANSWARDSCRH